MKKFLLLLLISPVSYLIFLIPSLHRRGAGGEVLAQSFQKYYDRDLGTNSISEVGHAVIQTSDGGFMAVGYSDNYGIGLKDVFAVRLDSDGDTVWTKLYGTSNGDDMARSVVQTADGGFAIAAETKSTSGAGGIDAVLFKIDANGALVWSKAFGGNKDDLGHSVIEMSDESLIMAGQALSYSANSYDEIFLVKVDKNGNLLWSKTLSGGSGEVARSIAKTSDGGFIISGDENSFNYGVSMVKFNASGDTSWCHTYRAGFSAYEGFGVNQTNDGGYVMAANTYGGSIGGKDMIALKVTATGSISWVREIGSINTELATDIIQTNDGGYVISGTAMPGGSYYDMVLAKLNSSGTLQWSKNYSGQYGTTYAMDARYQVSKTSDNGLIAIGSLYNNFGNTLNALYNGYDMMIVKVDSTGDGFSSGCVRDANLQTAAAAWTAYGAPFVVTAVNPTVSNSIFTQKNTAGNYGKVGVRINFSTTAVTCGLCDGSATATTCDSSGFYCSGTNPYTFQWSNGQMDATATGLCFGNYIVTVSDFVGCTGIDSVLVSTGALAQDICLVTVDSSSTRNLIVWEKPVTTSIDSFRIYREIGFNNYVKLGAVAYADLSKFTDTVQGINPNNTSYRYKITSLDNCGNESIKSGEHKTIHLQISQALPQGANLSWTDYLGYSFTQYRILRDSYNNNNWQVIDSVSFSITSYTDTSQLPNARYIIEAAHPSGCTVTKSVENHNSSRSNKTYPLAPQGLGNSEEIAGFEIYPNPNNGVFEILLPPSRPNIPLEVKIQNILGEKVFEISSINQGDIKMAVDLGLQKPGFYYCTLTQERKSFSRKLIIYK